MKKIFDCQLRESVTTVFQADDIADMLAWNEHYSEHALWVCDTHTAQYLPSSLHPVVLPPGEGAKIWSSIEILLAEAQKRSLGRDSRFIAFGGGVVCDMTAFASSIYMRGCQLSLIPTTVLSMVDASLGGKSAIDFRGIKNLIGSFYPAQEVLLCTDVLESLSEREFRNGLGEVLKHALLSPNTQFCDVLTQKRNAILRREKEAIQQMIISSLEIKKFYLEQDPQETRGIRDALNLGHTFAHALEASEEFQLSHGEAVAWGVVKALEAGQLLTITSSQFAQLYKDLIISYGFSPYRPDINLKAFLSALKHDKKRKGSTTRFVIMEGQGVHRLMALEEELISKIIQHS